MTASAYGLIAAALFTVIFLAVMDLCSAAGVISRLWSMLRKRTFCHLGRHRESDHRVFTSFYALLLCRDCNHTMKRRELQAADFERRG